MTFFMSVLLWMVIAFALIIVASLIMVAFDHLTKKLSNGVQIAIRAVLSFLLVFLLALMWSALVPFF